MGKVLSFFKFIESLETPCYFEIMFKRGNKKCFGRGVIVDDSMSAIEVTDLETGKTELMDIQTLSTELKKKIIILKTLRRLSEEDILDYEELLEGVLYEGSNPQETVVEEGESLKESKEQKKSKESKMDVRKIPTLKILVPHMNSIQEKALIGRLHRLNSLGKWDILELSLVESAGNLVVSGKVKSVGKSDLRELKELILLHFKEIIGKEPSKVKFVIKEQ